SDKHGIFRTTHASKKDRTSGLTQFGRALYELNIDIICANTPQSLDHKPSHGRRIEAASHHNIADGDADRRLAFWNVACFRVLPPRDARGSEGAAYHKQTCNKKPV
ncbi:hypothetical protein VP03_29665, partial [Sinorhizobium meliloti]